MTISTLLLLVAVILFVLACFSRTASAPLIPAGLACFAGAFLIGGLAIG